MVVDEGKPGMSCFPVELHEKLVDGGVSLHSIDGGTDCKAEWMPRVVISALIQLRAIASILDH